MLRPSACANATDSAPPTGQARASGTSCGISSRLTATSRRSRRRPHSHPPATYSLPTLSPHTLTPLSPRRTLTPPNPAPLSPRPTPTRCQGIQVGLDRAQASRLPDAHAQHLHHVDLRQEHQQLRHARRPLRPPGWRRVRRSKLQRPSGGTRMSCHVALSRTKLFGLLMMPPMPAPPAISWTPLACPCASPMPHSLGRLVRVLLRRRPRWLPAAVRAVPPDPLWRPTRPLAPHPPPRTPPRTPLRAPLVTRVAQLSGAGCAIAAPATASARSPLRWSAATARWPSSASAWRCSTGCGTRSGPTRSSWPASTVRPTRTTGGWPSRSRP